MEIGPTGNFSQGKLDPTDEGELALAIGIHPEKNVIIVEFGTKLSWLGLDPDSARVMAGMLIQRAQELEQRIAGTNPTTG